MFEYRFIRFYYDSVYNMFRPIIFDCNLPYSDIYNEYSKGFTNDKDYQM